MLVLFPIEIEMHKRWLIHSTINHFIKIRFEERKKKRDLKSLTRVHLTRISSNSNRLISVPRVRHVALLAARFILRDAQSPRINQNWRKERRWHISRRYIYAPLIILSGRIRFSRAAENFVNFPTLRHAVW